MALGVLSNQRSQAFLKHWLKHVILSLSKIPLGSHWLWERKTFHNLLRSTDEQAGFHLPASAGEVGSIPGWRRSPGEAKSDPRHYLSLLFSSSVRSNSTTPQTIAHQAPLSMGFLRQEYWSGVAISFFRGSSRHRDRSWVSCLAGGFFTNWATLGILAWKIPWTEKAGMLQSMGLQSQIQLSD